MKNLVIIPLLFISFICSSQISMDSVSYKAITVDAYIGPAHNHYRNKSELVLFFTKTCLITNSGDQMGRIDFIEPVQTIVLPNLTSVLSIQGKDKGGFNCAVFYGMDNISKKYFIYICYKNIEFFYTCEPTTELPWYKEPEKYLTIEEVLGKKIFQE